MKKPHLTPETPRLSDLPGNAFRDKSGQLLCASCSDAHQLQIWRECDHHDVRENRVVVLCASCSKKLIGPHPRLYHQLMTGEVVPGTMSICATCVHESRLVCELAGELRRQDFTPEPGAAFIDGPGVHRMAIIAYQPITGCKGKASYAVA
jgi:hypothetical protein